MKRYLQPDIVCSEKYHDTSPYRFLPTGHLAEPKTQSNTPEAPSQKCV